MAVILDGSYIGAELRNVKNKDGIEEPRVVMGIASGLDYYHVFMNKDVTLAFVSDHYKIGDNIGVVVRPYVSRNGGIGFSDGRLGIVVEYVKV